MGLFSWLKGGGKEIYNLSYHVLGEALGKKLADVGMAKTTERIFEDKRGELVADIMAVAPDNENLLRRYRKAMEEHWEPKLTNLLTKIPRIEIEEIEVEKIGKGGEKKKEKKAVRKEIRKEILKKLNNMPDVEFDQYLAMLENDLVKQVIIRLALPVVTTAKVAKENAEKARDFLGEKIKKRIEELNRRKIER